MNRKPKQSAKKVSNKRLTAKKAQPIKPTNKRAATPEASQATTSKGSDRSKPNIAKRSLDNRAPSPSNVPLPANVPPRAEQRPLEQEDYYHGMLPRADVNTLLVNQGDFIVRLTQKMEGAPKEVAISVMWDGQKRHIIPAKTSNGTYYTDNLEFACVGDLVRFYHKKKIPIKSACPWLLLNPISKPDWELNKQQITCEKMIGSGAFGEVFKGVLAAPTKSAIPVAVKVCSAEKMTKANLLEFMKEARLMRAYDHPNVVKFYGVVTEEPVMIVMEFVCGGSLDKFLQKKGYGATSIQEQLQYCLGAAKGMEYLHAQGCMHRDVAARNCLIDGDGIVKISDFGLCRKDENYKMDPHKKLPIRWLSPETLSQALCTFKSDVFSFGILMWEIYSDGDEPYPGMMAAEVHQQVKAGYRMPPPPRMQFEVKEVLNQCWEENPDRRPAFSSIVAQLTDAQSQQQFTSSTHSK